MTRSSVASSDGIERSNDCVLYWRMQDKVPIVPKYRLNCCSLENTFYSVHLQSVRFTRVCTLPLNVCTFLSRSQYIVTSLSSRILVGTLVFEKIESCKSDARTLKSKKLQISIYNIFFKNYLRRFCFIWFASCLAYSLSFCF